MPTFGSLFSGIGGMDLGLEWAGWEVKWQVEIDGFCQRLLAKHWPDVPRYGDVREIAALPYVDLIAGGFPCQDISVAGRGAGIEGERSGLWSEFNRIIRLVRPRLALVENVPALLGRGLGRVLGDLAESGYDAEWDCIPAAAVGAPHLRDRVFIVAHTAQHRFARPWAARERWPRLTDYGWWAVEPDVGRVAHGIPSRVDRVEGLGNAVVPQVAEWIGRRILRAIECPSSD